MKFFHLSDLHLGKRVNEFSMIDEQKYILAKIVGEVDKEKPDGVIIAGDVYDKSVPSAEAVELFDSFLSKLAERDLQIFVISGNHDSPERIAFGAKLMQKSGVHVSPVYNGCVTPVKLNDSFGTVNVYLLPFIKPAILKSDSLKKIFDGQNLDTYTDAVRAAINEMNVKANDKLERNVLVCHQFVTGASRSDSEEISVGGMDNVDANVFSDFDYVALGHIHGPQKISDKIRYCGTPLKYSFSECSHKKSITVVELLQKGNVKIDTIEITPKHDMREVRGTYNEVTERKFIESQNADDFLHITLTDEDDIPNALGVLQQLYPNLMKFDYDNKRTNAVGFSGESADAENKTPSELFQEFYELQNGMEMGDEQKKFVEELIEKIWEERDATD